MAKRLTCEKDVKAEVKKLLDRYGAWWYMPVQTGYSRKGVPDFLACLNGHFLAVETKFGNNKPTQHQKNEICDILAADGYALVINERTLYRLEGLLSALEEEPQ